MAEYDLPVRYVTSEGRVFMGMRYVRTYGRRRPPKMDPNERITKKKLNNPILWAQLEAVSKGTLVNHLGRGHARRIEDHPYFR